MHVTHQRSLGKLGGCEIDYGSDLDIVFVAPRGVKNLPALQKVAVAVMDLLTSQTGLGVAFHVDARLRPDGEKGLLVNTLDAYEDYYRRRAYFLRLLKQKKVAQLPGSVLDAIARTGHKLLAFRPPHLAFEIHLPGQPDDELLVGVEIPVLTKSQRAAYLKFQLKERPTLGLALLLELDGDTITCRPMKGTVKRGRRQEARTRGARPSSDRAAPRTRWPRLARRPREASPHQGRTPCPVPLDG